MAIVVRPLPEPCQECCEGDECCDADECDLCPVPTGTNCYTMQAVGIFDQDLLCLNDPVITLGRDGFSGCNFIGSAPTACDWDTICARVCCSEQLQEDPPVVGEIHCLGQTIVNMLQCDEDSCLWEYVFKFGTSSVGVCPCRQVEVRIGVCQPIASGFCPPVGLIGPGGPHTVLYTDSMNIDGCADCPPKCIIDSNITFGDLLVGTC